MPQPTTMIITNESSNPVLKVNDLIMLFLATIVAIALFLEEKTPVVVAILLVILFLCGCYISWHLIRVLPWVGQIRANSRRFIATLVIIFLIWAGIVGAYGIIKWPVRQYSIDVILKQSTKWTAKRRTAVKASLDDYHSYLQGLGFPFPRQIPPIALGKGPVTSAGGVWTAGQLFSSIIIPEDESAGVDAKVIVQSYSRYIFNGYLFWDNSAVAKQFGGSSAAIFYCYYASSFLQTNTCPPQSNWPMESRRWIDALWEIRSKYGQDYADRLMFYTFSMWSTSVTKTENFDRFFFNKLLSGETVIDSDQEAFKRLQDILTAHGIVAQAN
jgi:hypothetical protein